LLPSLFGFFLLTIAVQLFFLFFVLNKINTTENVPETPPKKPLGVSVIVCAWNELENLKQLIPLLNDQQYPDYEIIIIDDRSWDGTYDFLLSEYNNHKKVRFITIKETPEHLSSKKYALTLGIKNAQKEVILLTDADCRPQSDHWISGMAEFLGPQKDIVLGYSPYQKIPGFLNKIIRYETFLTALQYFSFSLYGHPYMGVGRNLMYKKSLFLNNRGFAKHTNIMGGDDDLFINDVATQQNTAICLNPDTFMYSFPKETWENWYRQKTRHISVSKYYLPTNKWLLGILAGSQIWFWLTFLIILPFTFKIKLIYWLLGSWAVKIVCQWIIYYKANKRLSDSIEWYNIPIYDFCMTWYYLIMGVMGVWNRRKKLRWK
jgi:glycosyltransferase involved in cell wall biosynthesis